MKRLYLLVLLSLILLNVVSADINLPAGKQNECISLKQTCDTCTYVNISTVARGGANATTFYLNTPMTKYGVDYNYSFCNTSVIGDYTYTVYGDKDGTLQTENGYFKISPSGFTETLGFYIIIIILSLGLVIFGYYAEDATIVILGAMGLSFIGIYFLLNGINGMKDTVYTYAISIIILCLAGYLLIKASQEFLN